MKSLELGTCAGKDVQKPLSIKFIIFNGLLRSLFLLGLLTSIHDLYLTPRIVSVAPYERIKPVAHAKRLILIVADGLRADVAFKGFKESGELVVMPNLFNRAKGKDAIWTISLADAPTESRPNHVAMLAGVPEEHSNLYKGWKENGSDFDHLLKRANFAVAIGAPDVVPYFNKPDTIKTKVFPSSWYRSMIDTSDLDRFTVDEYIKMLKHLPEESHQEGAVWFLHLAGIDTAGHRFGALSKEYEQNAAVVDELLNTIEEETRKYFQDDQTLFVFTSDHGFPDVGGHGTTDIHARTCPFVAWGIKELTCTGTPCKEIIEEKSISSLLCTLLGLSIPANIISPIPACFIKEKTLAMAASYGQLVDEFTSQQKSLDIKSKLGGILTSAGKRQVEKELKGLEVEIETDTLYNPKRRLSNLLKEIVRERQVLFASRWIIIALPLLFGCIVMGFERGMHALSSKRIARSILASLVVSLIWYVVCWSSMMSFGQSMLTALYLSFVNIKGGLALTMLMETTISSLMMITVLYTPKTWIVILMLASWRIARYSKIAGIQVLIMGTCLFLPNYWSDGKMAMAIHNIGCIICIPFCLYKTIAKSYRMSSDLELWAIKIALIILGIYLKIRLLIMHVTSSSSYSSLFFTIAWLVFISILVVYMVLALNIVRKRIDEPSIKPAMAFILTSSLLMSIIDLSLLASLTLVLWYLSFTLAQDEEVSFYTSLGTMDREKVCHYDLFGGLLLLSFGPFGIKGLVDRSIYNAVPLRGIFGIFNSIQVIVMLLFGLVAIRTLMVKIMSIEPLQSTIKGTFNLAFRSAGWVALAMVVLMPQHESWLEIGLGLAKAAIAAVFPFFSSLLLASFLWSLAKD